MSLLLSNEEVTPRQKDILLLLAVGLNDKEIAEALNFSPATVRVELRIIYSKFGENSRNGAVGTAFCLGIISANEVTEKKLQYIANNIANIKD